jgi:hypothetical protein
VRDVTHGTGYVKVQLDRNGIWVIIAITTLSINDTFGVHFRVRATFTLLCEDLVAAFCREPRSFCPDGPGAIAVTSVTHYAPSPTNSSL